VWKGSTDFFAFVKKSNNILYGAPLFSTVADDYQYRCSWKIETRQVEVSDAKGSNYLAKSLTREQAFSQRQVDKHLRHKDSLQKLSQHLRDSLRLTAMMQVRSRVVPQNIRPEAPTLSPDPVSTPPRPISHSLHFHSSPTYPLPGFSSFSCTVASPQLKAL
jgi:hypothetical protein